MTSSDTPDTGAGTPRDDGRPWPEAETEDEVMRVMSSDNPRSRYHRESRVDGYSGWTCIPLVDVIQLRADAIDAARSRPATDPAGLDVERLAEAYDAGHHDGMEQHDDVGYCQHDGREYARLSVADGPGPEEAGREKETDDVA